MDGSRGVGAEGESFKMNGYTFKRGNANLSKNAVTSFVNIGKNLPLLN